MPRQTRVTKAQKEARINKVYDMLIAGARRYQIFQYVKAKTDWNVDDRQIDRYIAEANALILAESDFHRQREYGRALAGVNDLIRRCVSIQDIRGEMQARRELHKLLALYPETDTQTATGQQILKLVMPGKPRHDDDETE
jgi:hypothetical protein